MEQVIAQIEAKISLNKVSKMDQQVQELKQ